MPVPLPTVQHPARGARTRRDLCPGAWRPWPAEDGLLVRLRLVGGRLPVRALASLLDVAERYGDGRVHLTGRANLQVRALPGVDGRVAPEALAGLEATGLLPSRTHELARNLMVSPQTGLAGGHADLRPIAAALDERLCAETRLAGLPGRFLFVLDDGRGDLVERRCDLGLVALDRELGQLRVGAGWGPVVPLAETAGRLVSLAADFVDARGAGPDAPWHVAELDGRLVPPARVDGRVPDPTPPPSYGEVPGGLHLRAPDKGLDRAWAARLRDVTEVVVTPWRGVLVPGEPR